jgi:hypothetical protein
MRHVLISQQISTEIYFSYVSQAAGVSCLRAVSRTETLCRIQFCLISLRIL